MSNRRRYLMLKITGRSKLYVDGVVSEQTHRNGSGEECQEWDEMFYASNGIVIDSCACPEWYNDRWNTLYVRGDAPDYDDTNLQMTINNFFRVMEAVHEYNKTYEG